MIYKPSGKRLQNFSADLHIHTCLSPCASLDLSPQGIVDQARDKGLDIIAITDHNTAKNVLAVMLQGAKQHLTVIPGLEVQTREEVHLLTLFPDWPSASAWDEEVRRHLPDVLNDPETFGDQPLVDAGGNIIGYEERLLLNSTDFSLEEVRKRVEEYGGMTIPSHFDRGSFSLISQLGWVPEGMKLEALEMSRWSDSRKMRERAEAPSWVPRISSSDAHCLKDIGSARTIFLLAEATLGEIRLACRERTGRRIVQRIDSGIPRL